MFQLFSSNSANDLWWQLACKFRAMGGTVSQSSRVGPTAELLHAALELRNPRDRWVSSRSPAINIAFALAEVVWIIRGRNDSAFLNYFNSRLPEFAGSGTTYHGAYGHRLRHAMGFDQLNAAYDALRTNPTSRQVVLNIWNATTDFPLNNGEPASPDVPCNVVAMLKVRDGKLEWTQIMRSNDLFRGFVHNIVQFTCLHEIMAGWLGLDLGSYHHFSDSLHLYDDDAADLARSSKCELPASMDQLNLPKTESDEMFGALEQLIETVISPAAKAEHIVRVLESMVLPSAIQNMACILTCEGLRRRGRKLELESALNVCTNPAYSFLFHRWLSRVGYPIDA
jgi:thymidylate synthase